MTTSSASGPLLPAVSLVASPSRRRQVLDLATEIDRCGFAGIACPSLGNALGLCVSLAHVTTKIPFWTSIQPIYLASAVETAGIAAYAHEVSGGRFRLGIGVSHAPALKRNGIGERPTPLADTRAFVAGLRDAAVRVGDLPPIVLATLRDRMLDLAVEVADGAVWANASRSVIAGQLARIDGARRNELFLGNMIPTVIDADRSAARAVHRKTLTGYVSLPNYRNYWKAAGYVAEMEAIEAAIAAGQRDRLPELMSDAWVDDCTLSGSASDVREGVEAWRDAGITTPILVMSSTSGGQAKAVGELLDAYA